MRCEWRGFNSSTIHHSIPFHQFSTYNNAQFICTQRVNHNSIIDTRRWLWFEFFSQLCDDVKIGFSAEHWLKPNPIEWPIFNAGRRNIYCNKSYIYLHTAHWMRVWTPVVRFALWSFTLLPMPIITLYFFLVFLLLSLSEPLIFLCCCATALSPFELNRRSNVVADLTL